jgi:hypothetical protein
VTRKDYVHEVSSGDHAVSRDNCERKTNQIRRRVVTVAYCINVKSKDSDFTEMRSVTILYGAKLARAVANNAARIGSKQGSTE